MFFLFLNSSSAYTLINQGYIYTSKRFCSKFIWVWPKPSFLSQRKIIKEKKKASLWVFSYCSSSERSIFQPFLNLHKPSFKLIFICFSWISPDWLYYGDNINWFPQWVINPVSTLMNKISLINAKKQYQQLLQIKRVIKTYWAVTSSDKSPDNISLRLAHTQQLVRMKWSLSRALNRIQGWLHTS